MSNIPPTRGELYADIPYGEADTASIRLSGISSDGTLRFTPKSIGFLSAVGGRTERGAGFTQEAGVAGKIFLRSGAEQVAAEVSDVRREKIQMPEPAVGLVGEEWLSAMPDSYKQIFKDNGIDIKTLSKYDNYEDLEDNYQKLVYSLQNSSELERYKFDHPKSYWTAGFSSFTGNVLTDPMMLLMPGGAGLAKAGVTKVLGTQVAKQGALNILRVGAKEGLELSLAQQVKIKAGLAIGRLGRGENAVTAVSGIGRGAITSRILDGVQGGALMATIDARMQKYEHEVFTKWGMVEGELQHSWMRTGMGSLAGIGLAQLFPTYKNYRRQGSILSSNVIEDDLITRQAAARILRNPEEALKFVDMPDAEKMLMIKSLSENIFDNDTAQRLPWMGDRAGSYFDDLEVQTNIKREDVLLFLLDFPTPKELSRFLPELDTSEIARINSNRIKLEGQNKKVVDEYRKTARELNTVLADIKKKAGSRRVLTRKEETVIADLYEKKEALSLKFKDLQAQRDQLDSVLGGGWIFKKTAATENALSLRTLKKQADEAKAKADRFTKRLEEAQKKHAEIETANRIKEKAALQDEYSRLDTELKNKEASLLETQFDHNPTSAEIDAYLNSRIRSVEEAKADLAKANATLQKSLEEYRIKKGALKDSSQSDAQRSLASQRSAVKAANDTLRVAEKAFDSTKQDYRADRIVGLMKEIKELRANRKDVKDVLDRFDKAKRVPKKKELVLLNEIYSLKHEVKTNSIAASDAWSKHSRLAAKTAEATDAALNARPTSRTAFRATENTSKFLNDIIRNPNKLSQLGDDQLARIIDDLTLLSPEVRGSLKGIDDIFESVEVLRTALGDRDRIQKIRSEISGAASRVRNAFDDENVRLGSMSQRSAAIIKRHLETIEDANIHEKSIDQQVLVWKHMFDGDAAGEYKFINTGVGESVRQFLSRYTGFFSIANVFQRLDAAAKRAGKAGDRTDHNILGAVLNLLDQSTGARQRKSAINPSREVVQSSHHNSNRAARESYEAMTAILDDLELTNSRTNTPEAASLYRDTLRWAGGIGREGADPRVAKAGARFRSWLDSHGERGTSNGFFAVTKDNWIPLHVNEGNMVNAAKYGDLAASYHQHLARGWQASDELHMGTLRELGWINRDAEGFFITTEGLKALKVESNEIRMKDLESLKIDKSNLDEPSLNAYTAALLSTNGEMAYVAKNAVNRRLYGTNVFQTPENIGSAILRSSRDNDITVSRRDYQSSQKMDASFWLSDEVLKLGIIETDIPQIVHGYAHRTLFSIYQQDSMNALSGRTGLSWESYVKFLTIEAREIKDVDVRLIAVEAMEQVKRVNDMHKLNHVYVKDGDEALVTSTAGALSRIFVTGLSPLLAGVERGTLAAHDLVSGEFGSMIHAFIETFKVGNKRVKDEYKDFVQAIEDVTLTTRHYEVTGEMHANLAPTRSDQRWAPFAQVGEPGNRLQGLAGSARNLFGESHVTAINRAYAARQATRQVREVLPKLGRAVVALQGKGDISPKEFRAIMREAGIGSHQEEVVRRMLDNGLGDKETLLNVTRALESNGGTFDDVRSLVRIMNEQDSSGDTASKVIGVMEAWIDAMVPHGSVLSNPATDSGMSKMMLSFTSYTMNWLNITAKLYGNKPLYKAATYVMLSSFLEYMSWTGRRLITGTLPEDYWEDMKENPEKLLGQFIGRAPIGGPIIGPAVGAALNGFSTSAGPASANIVLGKLNRMYRIITDDEDDLKFLKAGAEITPGWYIDAAEKRLIEHFESNRE